MVRIATGCHWPPVLSLLLLFAVSLGVGATPILHTLGNSSGLGNAHCPRRYSLGVTGKETILTPTLKTHLPGLDRRAVERGQC